jgi:hypothetical protein
MRYALLLHAVIEWKTDSLKIGPICSTAAPYSLNACFLHDVAEHTPLLPFFVSIQIHNLPTVNVNEMSIKFSALMLLALISCSCSQNTPSLSTDEKQTIADSVRQTLHNYFADVKTHGLIAEFNYLDNSPDFFWVPPGYSGAISFDSVAAVLKHNAPLYKSINNAWDTLHIVPINHNIATFTGRLRSKIIFTSGDTSEFLLVETGVLVKRKNQWKLINGQTSLLTVHN